MIVTGVRYHSVQWTQVKLVPTDHTGSCYAVGCITDSVNCYAKVEGEQVFGSFPSDHHVKQQRNCEMGEIDSAEVH
jgi:hypothetical protein